jgi:predicted nucleotidyltransferase
MDRRLVEYCITLAKVDRQDVRFVVLNGSASEGTDRAHSDYDIALVTKYERSRNEYWGIFDNRLVALWCMGPASYRAEFYSFEDDTFWWRRAKVRKERLLYGGAGDFRNFRKFALSQKWTRSRQNRVIIANYGNAIEYLEKLLNGGSNMVFYRNCASFSNRFVQLLAGMNRMDVVSGRTMYQQALGARIRPKGLRRHLMLVSGFDGKRRDRTAALRSAKKLMRWATGYLIEQYGIEELGADRGLIDVLRSIHSI